MKKLGKRIWNIFKYTGAGIVFLLVLMFLIPYLFPGFVSEKIKKWSNEAIETKLEFSKARLSFFNHFPSLTLTLYDVSLTGSAPFNNDTLVAANEIALGVDLSSVFSKTLRIDEIYVTRGNIKILVSENGKPNYNIYKSGNSKQSAAADTGSATLKIARIQIEDCAFLYNDQSIPFLVKASNFNYLGKGKLSDAVFSLKSKISMEAVDLQYDGEPYLTDKKLEATLRTRINTNSLELDFRKNDLKINQLPVSFKGVFYFLKNGYRMDFNASTGNTKLEYLFTALPPAYVKWLNKTNVDGNVELKTSLKGDYIASENKLPDLSFDLNIKNGGFATKAINQKITNIQLAFHLLLPQLNTNNLELKLDTIAATMGNDFIRGVVETKGLTNPHIKLNLQVVAHLDQWSAVLDLPGITGMKPGGLLQVNAAANGTYSTAKQLFPVLNSTFVWQNGTLLTNKYPSPVTDISVDLSLFNTRGTANDMKVAIKPISFQFEGQPFTLTANLNNWNNLVYQVSSKGSINIGKLYKVFAIDGYDVNGFIKTDLSLQGSQADATAGRYDLLQNKGTIELKNISLHTPYFPQSFLINSGAFHINNDQLIADQLQLSYRNNKATLTGSFSNLINHLLKPDAPLNGTLSLSSKELFVHEFISEEEPTNNKQKTTSVPASTETGVVLLPVNLSMQFHSSIDKVDYNGLNLYNWIADVTLQKGKLTVSKSAFRLAGAPVQMEASYEPINLKQANFTYHVNVKEADIQTAYKEIQLFRELLTSAAAVKGKVSLDYSLNGILNDSLYPVMNTLYGGGVLSIKNPSFKGFTLFAAIGKKTGKDSLNEKRIAKQTVQLKTTIANNIITIEKVKLKVAGFRPRFEGQVGLDGRLNLKARLGLPPFGLFGIPLTITGTQDNPVVQFRKGKNGKSLDEDADADDKKEANQATDNSKQQ